MEVRRRGPTIAAAVAALLLAAAAPVGAVITFDLLHDTQRTRDNLGDELATGALAPGVALAAGPEAPGLGELEAIWFARERYLQLGEAQRAQQQIQLLWELAAQRGYRNLTAYAAVLVREARRRMDAGDLEQAARALGDARRIAPDEPAVYAAGAKLALRRSPFNLVPAWEQLLESARAVRRSFRAQVGLAGSAIATLRGGLAFFFAVSVGVLFIAASPRVAHDVRESLPIGSERTRLVLSWLVVATPALIGLSPWWWPILGGLVLWPYVEARARALIAVAALFALAVPALYRAEARLLTIPDRPLLAAVVAVREGHWAPADREELARQAEAGSAGVAGVTALGMASRREGRLAEAEAAYRAGLEAAPSDPVLWNNLGNVAYARRDIPAAIEHYTKAATLAPGLFAPHFNLGLAYRESFKFGEGEAESQRAAGIDPEAVAYFAGLDPARVREFTVDALPPVTSLWRLARAEDERLEPAARGAFAALLLGPSAAAWPLVLGALIVVAVAGGALRLRRGTSTACARCGRVFCHRCQAGRRSALCSQCHHIFVKKEGVDARARVQKMGDIKTHRTVLRVRHLALGALAPGAGQLSAGRFWTGLLLLAPASLLETRLLFGAGRFPGPWSVGAPAGLAALAGWVCLAALWAGGLALAWRSED